LSSNLNRSTLQRLIATFEAENRRHFDEYMRLNHSLRMELEANRQREQNLRLEAREKDTEIRRLTGEGNKVEELFRENSQLRVAVIEKEELVDQLSMALNNSYGELSSLRAQLREREETTRREQNPNTTLCTVCMDRRVGVMQPVSPYPIGEISFRGRSYSCRVSTSHAARCVPRAWTTVASAV